jgi:hypothetical protein
MSTPFGKYALTFGDVVKPLRTTFETFSNRRTGKNTSYTMTDAGLSAFSIFFMQSPSFLDFQRTIQEPAGWTGKTECWERQGVTALAGRAG